MQELYWDNEMIIIMINAPSAGSIVQPVHLQPGVLSLCTADFCDNGKGFNTHLITKQVADILGYVGFSSF